MFFLTARIHNFVFQNNFMANYSGDESEIRGFEIYIIPLYSETMRNNFLSINDKYRERIKLFFKENNLHYEIIHINPYLSIQNKTISLSDNVIDCVVIAIMSNPIGKNLKIMLGKTNLQSEIYILCTKNGISINIDGKKN
jgi:hypothetical protein